MNNFKDYIGNYRDISGFNLTTLNDFDIQDLVLFLDIDDTLGCSIKYQTEIYEPKENDTQEEILENKILKVEQINNNLYYFEFLSVDTIDINIITNHKILFQFKVFIKNFFCFLNKRNITDIYLFSAGSPIYIECIKITLNKYFLESEIHIKNYISVFDKERMYINNVISSNFTEKLLYIPKDMNEALNILGLENKIPLLIDDRGYCGANGFVINISVYASTIYDFIEKPIEKTNGLLIQS